MATGVSTMVLKGSRTVRQSCWRVGMNCDMTALSIPLALATFECSNSARKKQNKSCVQFVVS